MDDPMMPDLSHLSAEERAIIEQVLQRQRAEEQKEEEIAQRADKELDDIERQINERKENAQRLVGTQDDAICQICQKTKFADGIGHKCFYCQLRSCARCGGRTTSKNKNIWACSLCQKRQQILARTGKWFQHPSGAGGTGGDTAANSGGGQGTESPTAMMMAAEEEEAAAEAAAAFSPEAAPPHIKHQNTLHRQPSLEKNDSQLQFNTSAAASTSVQPPPTPKGTANGGVLMGRQQSITSATAAAQPIAAPVPRKSSRQQQAPSQPSTNGEPQRTAQAPQQPQQPVALLHQPMENCLESSLSAQFDQQQQQRIGYDSPARRGTSPSATAAATTADRRRASSRTTAGPTPQQQQQHPPKSSRPPTSDERRRAAAGGGPGTSPLPALQSASATAEHRSSHHNHQRPTATSSKGSPMTAPRSARRSKHSARPHQCSLSSSEEEQQHGAISDHTHRHSHAHQQQQQHLPAALPSSSSLQNAFAVQRQEQDFSERDLLRYIYGSHKLSNAGREGRVGRLIHTLK